MNLSESFRLVSTYKGGWRWWLEVVVGGGGWRWWLEVVVGGGGWRWWLEVVVGGGGWRWWLEVVVGGGGWRWWLEVVVGGGSMPPPHFFKSCYFCVLRHYNYFWNKDFSKKITFIHLSDPLILIFFPFGFWYFNISPYNRAICRCYFDTFPKP